MQYLEKTKAISVSELRTMNYKYYKVVQKQLDCLASGRRLGNAKSGWKGFINDSYYYTVMVQKVKNNYVVFGLYDVREIKKVVGIEMKEVENELMICKIHHGEMKSSELFCKIALDDCIELAKKFGFNSIITDIDNKDSNFYLLYKLVGFTSHSFVEEKQEGSEEFRVVNCFRYSLKNNKQE